MRPTININQRSGNVSHKTQGPELRTKPPQVGLGASLDTPYGFLEPQGNVLVVLKGKLRRRYTHPWGHPPRVFPCGFPAAVFIRKLAAAGYVVLGPASLSVWRLRGPATRGGKRQSAGGARRNLNPRAWAFEIQISNASFDSDDDVWLAGRRRRAVEKGPAAAQATSRGLPHLLPQRVVLPSPWTFVHVDCALLFAFVRRVVSGEKGPPSQRTSWRARRAMEGGAAARRDVLSHGELQAVAAAVSTIVLRCQQERALGRLKEHLRARRRRTLTQDPHDGAEFVATSEAVVQLCYALGCGVIPRATPRWWVKRRTGGTWEDLRLCDDVTDDYFRDKLRMSPWASGETYESSTCNFGIGRASGLIAIHDVIAALLRVFDDKIVWPTGVRKQVVLRAFADKGFPNCHGCIDCTHIYIDKPANARSEKYFDRKRRFSIVAQVVVDLDLRVLDVHMGYPGSCHDIRVLQLSSLSLRVEEGSLFRGPPVTLSFGVKTNGYLLADNGYPPAEWMVVPYGSTNQIVKQEQFDNKQKVARGAVERAFGRLKGMWRLFLRTHKTNLETLPQQFTAVCILHNLQIEAGIPFDENLLWEVDGNGVRRRVDLGIDEPLQPVSMLTSTHEALALRHALAERMKHE
ncbi:hypothetical protein CBR_g52083 [Chara braunii]|uniref:DDE Tnp4 domain-containing protein n=1 Tax=Chara braunii TaxID=69332 RepID=A0A388M9E9_CHABU|nr:hypothetical protein CBR_g52083 [Chara braunii]|eukprot:GBG91201.1 hypothetical protein CBR_g52083 [Chara braunii]